MPGLFRRLAARDECSVLATAVAVGFFLLVRELAVGVQTADVSGLLGFLAAWLESMVKDVTLCHERGV